MNFSFPVSESSDAISSLKWIHHFDAETGWILISWLLVKPTDQDLHWFTNLKRWKSLKKSYVHCVLNRWNMLFIMKQLLFIHLFWKKKKRTYNSMALRGSVAYNYFHYFISELWPLVVFSFYFFLFILCNFHSCTPPNSLIIWDIFMKFYRNVY